MKTFGLLGFPLSQSFSQKYFTSKFEQEQIDARFLNFELETIKEVPAMLEHHPYIAGLSVTIPYKEQIFDYLDEVDDKAKAIGAVNCVRLTWNNKKPYLKGFNTDVIGFSDSIKPLLKEHHTKALVLGTGGAAKAVAEAFRLMGIECRYVSRKPQGENDFAYEAIDEAIMKEYKVVVNCTPLGMFPKVDNCPDIPYQYASAEHLFYDLTYNPENTKFMLKGAEYGAVTKNGLEMLHLQAEAAWKIWNTSDSSNE